MRDQSEHKQRVYGTIMLALVWSASVGGLFLWNNHLSQDFSDSMARTDAIKAFNKDQALRQWAATHGGIYMEAGGDIVPSPYMKHIEERDVVTESGRLLTLVNPAAMLVHIMDEYFELYGVQGRLVSSEPLNPANEADPWENAAINSFKQGANEISEFTTVDNQEYYRLFRPMKASKPCLKCHGIQGYEVGDVLGGVGVKVPMDTYRQQLRMIFSGNVMSHGLTWLLGMIGLMVWHVRGIRNVRERVAARAKLTESYNNMEKLVKTRTAELERAKKNAETANQTKSDFLSSMSHELRTPLNSIIGFSSLMKEKSFGPQRNEQYQEYLDAINHSGKHLLELINDILDLSAIEAGALELHEETVSLVYVIETSVQSVRPQADEGKVSVDSTFDPKIPLIIADERRLGEIILNLLSNAIKFTPEGGNVSLSARLNDDGSFSISVTDTGIGMDEEEIGKAMNRFEQIDSGHNRKYEGTGLGLPLTKGLVEQHGGTMDVKSEKGQGTEITVTFPKERVVNSANGLEMGA